MDIDKPEPKMPLDQRDFFPDDIGRTQFPDEFYCQICDIRCTGSVTFQMHTEGSKHKLKVEQYKMMGERGQVKIDTPQTVKPRVIDSNREAKLHGTIKKYDVPIIGLQFVTEFQKADPAGAVRYVCNLCESKCDGNTIVAHLTGHKHRVAYFKECRPDIHSLITIHHSSKKKSEVSAASEQFAKDVQDKDGMGKVKVKIEIDKATEKATSRLLKSGGMEFDSLLEKIQSSSDAGAEFSASQGPDNKRPKLKSSGYDSFDPEAARNIGFSKTLGRKLPQPEYSDYGKTKTDHYQSMNEGLSHLYDNEFQDSSRKRPFSHIDRPSSDVMPVRGNPFRQGSSYAGQTDSQYGTADRHTDQPHLPDRERQTYRPGEPYQYRTTSRPPVSTPYSVTDRQSDRPPYSATDRQSITDRPPYSTTDRQRATERPPYGTTDRQSVTDRPQYGALQRPSVTERQSDRPPYGTMDRRTEVPPYGRPDHADTYTKNPVEVFDYGHSNKRTEEPPPNTEVQSHVQPHVQQNDKSGVVDDDTELFLKFLQPYNEDKISFDRTEEPPLNSEVQPHVQTHVQQEGKQGVEDEDTELFQQFLNWKRQQKAAAMGANSSENTSTASVDPPREKPKPKSNSMINTEEEAAMALQVSNALTQALLQYRLKHVPKELLSSESPASKAKSPAQSSSTAVRQPKSQVPAAPTNNPSVRKSKSQVPAPPHAATTGQIKQVAQSISTVVSAMASTDSSAAGSLTSAPATNVTAYTYGAFNTGTLPATNVVPGVASSIPSVTQGSQVPSQAGVLPPGYQYNTASYMYQQSQAYYSTPYTAAQQTGVPTAATNLPTGSLTAYGVSTVQPPVPPPQMVPAPPRGQPKKPPPPPPLSQKY
ncbi:hypothetical protein FSP39_013009 [Pinctada imbricata]|uniref:U1-type domain-containing protein n=1 Tax=Pinctada imbricata TaxID=66713 RepID=A0AA89CBU0_PINIB|nr:hypothetical protein FSP39_013009 [Pinctada imbricata]